MRVEEEDDTDEDDYDSDGESRALVAKATGARFSCNDLESSDAEESEDEMDGRIAPYHLMEKRSLEKSILLELEREHHLKVQVWRKSEVNYLHWRYATKVKSSEQFLHLLDYRNTQNQEKR
uniref:Uncharacterized protein n=1 Tax=Oryza sativa subsp. japonica TaxID=39947 RepID=Q6ZI47_ORYSJ|nr:unknown protein [Oryza sativa Japonica Group]BAD21616.1 unknown protein [Oryza sativa Japonica Group]